MKTQTDHAKLLFKSGLFFIGFWGFVTIVNLYAQHKALSIVSSIAPNSDYQHPVSYQDIILGSIPGFFAGCLIIYFSNLLKRNQGNIAALYNRLGYFKFVSVIYVCFIILLFLGYLYTFRNAS